MVAAVYNVFDGLELLPYSVSNIAPCVEGIIIVYQETGNSGEFDPNVKETVNFISSSTRQTVYCIPYQPDLGKAYGENERLKRDLGLHWAKKLGFTHFIDMDCDEFYIREEFLKEKKRVLQSGINGLVCGSQVYFKSPTLTIGLDTTLVPFIHKVDCKHGINRNYPYAWEAKRNIRIDPTRQLSFTDGIEWSDIVMMHYSWVRKDFKKKIRNSSARTNIERSTVLHDLVNSKDGYYCEFYRKHLTSCPNVFGLPEWSDLKTLYGGNQ